MKEIQVACAVIEQNGRVLATQRSAIMTMPLKWEFPGGKINSGETPGECLRREVREELSIEIAVGEAMPPVTHDYPDFRVMLYPFICRINSGKIILQEHAALAWLLPEELEKLDWAEADWPIIEEYLKKSRRSL